jgi:glycine cleavage system aminomethyltransferase T
MRCILIQCIIGGVECLAIMISYTGELGYELYMPKDKMKPVYKSLMDEGCQSKSF